MKLKDVKKLRKGDEVFLSCPDSKFSFLITISTIEVTGNIVKIIDINGEHTECFAGDLS